MNGRVLSVEGPTFKNMLGITRHCQIAFPSEEVQASEIVKEGVDVEVDVSASHVTISCDCGNFYNSI